LKTMHDSDATRFLGRLACFLPLLGGLLLVNWIGEQAPVRRCLFRSLDDAAEALVSGKSIWVRTNMSDLKAVWIEHSHMRPEVIVLGSSRALQISGDWFGSRRVLNAALLGGDFVDAVALFEACLETGKTPKLVLLELNPTLVFADKTAFSAALAGYFEHAMLRYKVFPPLFFTGPLKLDGLRWDPRLFSNRAVWRVADRYEPGGAVLQPDGTSAWDASESHATPDEVDRSVIAAMHTLDFHFQQWRETSRPGWFNRRILQAFLDDLHARGIRVVVLLVPVHPAAFDYYRQQGGYDESWIRDEMAGRGIAVVGSYSPAAVKATREDFFDDVHVHASALHRLLREGGIVE